jgi:hypothetical protein
MIPAALPNKTATREEMNTSEKYGSLMPGSEFLRPREISSDNNVPSVSGSTPELLNFFVVPIILVGHQRDQYFQETYYHDSLIRDFLDTSGPPSLETAAQVKNLLRRLRQTVVHPDLNNPDTATQHADSPIRQARWDVDCSAKFRFLQSLFTHLQSTSVQIAVVAAGRRICDILTTFFRGIGVAHRLQSYGSHEVADSGDTDRAPTAWIIDSESDIDYETPVLDGIIVLDGDARASDAKLSVLRMSPSSKMIHTFILAVPRSIEHLEQCLPVTLPTHARLRALVSGIHKLKHDAGRPEAGHVPTPEAASAVASMLDPVADVVWPLAGLSALQDVDLYSQAESELTARSTSDEIPNNDSNALKRPHSRVNSVSINVSTSPATKRVRAEEETDVPITVNMHDVEITHISDSIGRPTQHSQQDGLVLNLDGSSIAREARITVLYHATEARLATITKDLEMVQYRLEEERKLFLACRKERDILIAKGQATVERMSRLEVQNATLRAERSELKAQLESANLRLMNESIPERQEIEELHLAMAKVKLEAEKANKRAEAAERDVEYTRSMYQDSSSRAQELAQQNAALQTRVAQLDQMASGQQARAQQASKALYDFNLSRQNQKLSAMLKDREAGLKYRDEEITRLKEAGRGRIGTRASSVPRSPRHASPFMMAGRGSRQTSPAPAAGTRSHPLRNANASG